MAWWEPWLALLATFALLAALVPRIMTYLSPPTGDEPFYLMTAISILKDGDLNECNNYRQRDEQALYPSWYYDGKGREPGWLGWPRVPYPLPPHPAQLVPASRMCVGANQYTPLDPSTPLPSDGSHSELYSKHGLGLTLLVLPAFWAGGYPLVVYFLALLGAMLAAQVYIFARESTSKLWPAVLTWLAFAFTVPQLPYSFLIFPELPAALFVLYAFRRIRLWKNNWWQVTGIGLSLAFIPWLHYRFLPVVAALGLFVIYQDITHRREEGSGLRRRLTRYAVAFGPVLVSGLLLMAFFYQRYESVLPNAADHAGTGDLASTFRGMAGLFLDKQWGLLVAAPIYILCFVGVLLLATRREWRKDLVWLAIVFVPYYLVIANYAQWWGEWCPPARYLASILPLLALPFARSLEAITHWGYKVMYGALTAVSLLVTWGYMVQPQRMYHQPDGTNNLIFYALPQFLSKVPGVSFVGAQQFSMGLNDRLPSFVLPYFQYGQGRAAGDQSALTAWQLSVMPAAVILLLVAGAILLYWWEPKPVARGTAAPGAAGAPQPRPSSSPDAEQRTLPLEPAPAGEPSDGVAAEKASAGPPVGVDAAPEALIPADVVAANHLAEAGTGQEQAAALDLGKERSNG